MTAVPGTGATKTAIARTRRPAAARRLFTRITARTSRAGARRSAKARVALTETRVKTRRRVARVRRATRTLTSRVLRTSRPHARVRGARRLHARGLRTLLSAMEARPDDDSTSGFLGDDRHDRHGKRPAAEHPHSSDCGIAGVSPVVRTLSTAPPRQPRHRQTAGARRCRLRRQVCICQERQGRLPGAACRGAITTSPGDCRWTGG